MHEERFVALEWRGRESLALLENTALEAIRCPPRNICWWQAAPRSEGSAQRVAVMNSD